MRLVASTSAQLLRSRIRVELRLPDRDAGVPMGGGEQQLAAILDALVDVKPHDRSTLVDILREMPLTAGGTVVVPVGSYLFGDAELHRLLTDLAARGNLICVLFEDDDNQNIAGAARWLRSTGARVHLVRSQREEDDE